MLGAAVKLPVSSKGMVCTGSADRRSNQAVVATMVVVRQKDAKTVNLTKLSQHWVAPTRMRPLEA